MKKILVLLLSITPFFLTSQTIDSVALRQVDSLIQVASASANNQDITTAIELNKLAETFALEKFGRESVAYAHCCYNHGRVLINSGMVTDGLKWVFDALEIQEKVLGKMHIECGKTKYMIVYGFMELSQYEKGIDVALEAKSIIENTEGKTGNLYSSCINILAICYASIGELELAEPFFWEARSLAAKTGGPESEKYARFTSNLSHFYKLIGNYQKSLEFAKEATEISRNFLGDGGKKIYAASLGNLGSAYSRLNEFDKAEALYLESISIIAQIEGKESRVYLERMHDLAVLYSVTSKHQKALLLFEQILAIKEKIYGIDNLSYSNTANSLALLHLEMGEYEKAETVLASCIETNKKILGADSDNYLEELTNMAILYNAIGKYEAAETLHTDISGKLQRMMANGLHHLSEKEMEDYIGKFSYFQDCALSLAQTTFPGKRTGATLSQTCFDNALYFKGFMLHAVNRIRNSASVDSANAENILLLKSIQRRLGDAYSQPMEERDSSLMADLQTRANSLEKELARSIAGYADATRKVGWKDVHQHLRAGDVAIEFVHFAYYSKSAQRSTDSMFYAAIVLQPGADAPKFIPLFEEKQLTALLKAEEMPQPNFYNDLYATDKKGDQLYDLIWKPVMAAIPESSTIYCSPSGLLHRLNLAAIPTPDGKTLTETHRLTMLGSTRQLVVPFETKIANQNATAQLYGGIQYDASPAIAANADSNSDDLAARRGPDFTQNDSTLRGDNWNYLRWTDVEITTAAEVMNSKGIATTLKKGAEANEESFKAMGEDGPSPRILHVATHGFFFPDPKGEQANNEKAFKVSENPMIRSGLVLAAGNHAWKTGKPLRPGLEDGILTAYEISQMNLSSTELVVLSACETGLGDLVGNEGVYGLQRAFKIAGAKYLIMSLWQVPDFQTQVFMTAFYKHWLTDNKSVHEAFHATQSELKAKYGEAFKWAGFVLVE